MSNHVMLSGRWRFVLDPQDIGLTEKWWKRKDLFKDEITVPGAWQAQGYGDNRYCTPLCQARGIPPMVIEKTSYLGTAWYQREISIPREWRDKTIRLLFGGTHPRAEIWIDDNFIGMHKGSFLEHCHDITPHVTPGRRHILTVRISEFDQTKQTNKRSFGAVEGGTFNLLTWSGIYRDVKLEAKESSWIKQVLITPDIGNQQAKFKIRLAGEAADGLKLRLAVIGTDGKTAGLLETTADSGPEITVPLSDVKLWSPETPHLYRAAIILLDRSSRKLDEVSERFGMRELSVDGQKILLNGRPVFLRGYGDDQLYVHTLAPYLDRKMLEKDIKQAKDYGFNYVDFLFSIPNREYLDMADEMGLIIQCYPTQLIIEARNANPYYTRPEYVEKVIGQLYNHPSVAIYSVAAERYGWDLIQRQQIEQLREMTAKIDSTRLLSTTGGIDRSDVSRDRTDILEMAGGSFASIPEKLNVCRKPVILHEYLWWSSYPDPKLKEKYNQSAVRPFFIEYAEQVAREKGMSDLLPVFVENSQKMQSLERKLGIERARRNPGIKGYAIWMGKDLKEAVEGVWDDFGDPKNVSAEEFRESNAETVLLIDHDGLFRCYWSFEDIPIEMWLSHYGQAPIAGGVISWRIETADNNELLAEGALDNITCPVGTAERVACFRIRPKPTVKPMRAVLKANLEAGKISIANHWDFWLFPPLDEKVLSSRDLAGNLLLNSGDTQKIKVCDKIDDSFFECLADGGRIILMASGIFKERHAYFQNIEWNASTEGQSGTVVRNHPALGDFPHDNYCDLQFYGMLRTTPAIDLDCWPVRIEPIIRAIASYKACYNMGHLFEVRAGKGRILITTLDLKTNWANYPTSCVEKQYLIHQLRKYVASDSFAPKAEVPLSFIEQYFCRDRIKTK